MKAVKPMLHITVLGLLAAVPICASAEAPFGAPQIYLGGGVGYNWLNGQPFKDPNNPDHDFSHTHVTWKALAGIKFTPVLSVEGQYIDFGAHNKNSDNVKAHGWTAGAVLDVPILPIVTPYAKAGAFFWKSDGTFTSNGSVTGTGFNEKGTDFTWGGGVRFNITQSLDLRVEYERFRLDDTHVDNATAALQFTF